MQVLTFLNVMRPQVKGLDVDNLFVSHIQVNRAMRQRRRTYRAHGRVNPYMSSPCHIELVLSEKESGVKAEQVRGQCRGGNNGACCSATAERKRCAAEAPGPAACLAAWSAMQSSIARSSTRGCGLVGALEHGGSLARRAPYPGCDKCDRLPGGASCSHLLRPLPPGACSPTAQPPASAVTQRTSQHYQLACRRPRPDTVLSADLFLPALRLFCPSAHTGRQGEEAVQEAAGYQAALRRCVQVRLSSNTIAGQFLGGGGHSL